MAVLYNCKEKQTIGSTRFRAQFLALKPTRAARIWAHILGLADEAGTLTEKGRKWLRVGEFAGESYPPRGPSRTYPSVPPVPAPPTSLGLCMAECADPGGRAGRGVSGQEGAGPALEGHGDGAGLPQVVASGDGGVVAAPRDGQDGPRRRGGRAVARPVQAADFRALRRENARRNGLKGEK